MEFILGFFWLVGYGLYLMFKPYFDAVEQEKTDAKVRKIDLGKYSSEIDSIRKDMDLIRSGIKERFIQDMNQISNSALSSAKNEEMMKIFSDQNEGIMDELCVFIDNFDERLNSSGIPLKKVISMSNDILDTFKEYLDKGDEGQEEEFEFEGNTNDWEGVGEEPSILSAELRSPLEILGLQEGFTQSDLRNTYLDLVKRLHPDKWLDRPIDVQYAMSEELKEVNLAYEFLKKSH